MILRLLAAAIACALVAPAAASASFPGRNGEITAAAPFASVRHVVAIGPGGSITRVTQPEARADRRRDTFAPEWLADGSRLLFVERAPDNARTLWSAAPGGGDQRRLSGPLRIAGGMNDPGPSVSPDGERIAYSRFGGIFTSRLDGTDERELRRERRCTRPDGSIDPPECDFTTQPKWSPDGRWLAVVRNDSTGPISTQGIWLMDARTGRLVRRIAGRGSNVDWAPSSRHIVFASPTGGSDERTGRVTGGNLWIARIDGRSRRRVVRGHGTAETHPVWSPDGKWIAWVKLRYGPGDVGFDVVPTVWRQRVAGGRPQRLATLPQPYVDETFFEEPTIAWQPLP